MLIYYIKQTLFLTLLVAGPVVLVTSVLGLLLGFLQAVFQLQDQALPFAIKLVGVTVILLALGPWMSQLMIDFTGDIFSLIAHKQSRL
ncbi:MAG TPA: type III secretion system export apparatus subunit SctS [Limnobacter sp.]|nr:type III secretion system export apparatus subunit SctS [Limnobacter sp.]